MIKQLGEEMGLRFRDEKRKREPLPEGPKGFLVYRGIYGIPFTTNGKVSGSWIPPSTLPKEMGNKEMPGYWADVNSNNKLNMNGDVVPATLEERLQRAFRRF